jgi:hypothetical protein
MMPTAIPNAPSAAHEVWVYLSSSPLLWLTLTLIAYQGAYALYRRYNFNPLLNPVALSVIVIVATLKLSDTPYQLYFDGAQFVHFLLGPAVVALAIPLYSNICAAMPSASSSHCWPARSRRSPRRSVRPGHWAPAIPRCAPWCRRASRRQSRWVSAKSSAARLR